MHEIEKQVQEEYNFDIGSGVNSKDGYIMNTSIGKLVLKKSTFKPETMLFIHNAKEHLSDHHFSHTDRYLCTKEGYPFFLWKDEYYTITRYLEGRESDFENSKDIKKATTLLAQMHKASIGFKPEGLLEIRNDLGKMPLSFEKRLGELKKLKKLAAKNKSRFDRLFADYVDYFVASGEKALKRIKEPSYAAIVEKSKNEGILCHHDYNHRSVILTEDTQWLVKFDFCCIDIKAYDIANLLRRKMRKSGWVFKEAKIIVDEYRKTENISQDEFVIIKAMMEFPQKFWRVANKFYNSRRSWAEKSYLHRLEDVIAEVAPHQQLMERFDELI